MTTLDTIRMLCERIATQFEPEKIILFGSYAYGEPTSDSDVDLLIIMPFEGKSVYQAAAIASVIDYDFSLDLIVRRPDDVAIAYQEHDPLIRMALDRGKVLYDKNHPQMLNFLELLEYLS